MLPIIPVSSQFSLLCLKELLMCSPNIVSLSGFNNFLLPQPQKLPCNGLDLNLGGIKQAETRGAIFSLLLSKIAHSKIKIAAWIPQPSHLGEAPGPWTEFFHGCSAAEPAAHSSPWPQNHEFIKKHWLKYCNTQERCCDIFLQMKKLTFFFFLASGVVLKKYCIFCAKMFFRATVFKCLFLQDCAF